MIKQIITGNRQSIFDIALQEYGSIEGVQLLIADNPTIDINTELQPGTKLLIKSSAIDQGIVNYYSTNKIKPATHTTMPLTATEADFLGTEDGKILGTQGASQLQTE